MISLSFLMIIIILIPFTLIFTAISISKKNIINQEKMSPFECGFDPLSANRLPFSIQFFLISMIFLIFDVEITILIPLIISTFSFSLSKLSLGIMFLMILLMGLYLEYFDNSIEWKK